jgi:hypothetical protein
MLNEMLAPYLYETTIDCGTFGELDVEVGYDYSPPQRANLSGPMEDACPALDDEINILFMRFPFESRIQMPFSEMDEGTQQAIFDGIREDRADDDDGEADRAREE